MIGTFPREVALLLKEQVDKTYTRAEATFGRAFTRPRFEVDRALTSVAGRAHLRENRIRLSESLFLADPETFVRDTVVHEIGHLIAWQLVGSRGHGPDWVVTMMALGADSTKRCHSYDTEAALQQRVRRIDQAIGL